VGVIKRGVGGGLWISQKHGGLASSEGSNRSYKRKKKKEKKIKRGKKEKKKKRKKRGKKKGYNHVK